MKAFELRDKRAMITGASKGIGLGMARGLAEAGAEIILVARHEKDLQAASESLKDTGRQIDFAPFDLQNFKAIGDWYKETTQQFGAADILVNNAAMSKRCMAEDIPLEDWQQIMDLNLSAVFALSQAFARERIESGATGKIINIASLMTAASRPSTTAYTASKGGIGQLTKALAIDWASKGILVNAIAPGYVATPLTQPLYEDADFDAWVRKRCPLGRWATPEDFAGPAVFLASAASDFITGEILYVDGGWISTF